MTGSLRALLEAGVAKAPDKVMIRADGVELTWSRLHDRACRVAAALVRDGVKPQDRVIYLGKKRSALF
jgi:acyl-CoA synthetase (AMP-forming)/AMP-acid ligase II